MKKLLILLLIFAALAAFVYYYEIAGKEKRDEAKEKAESLLQIKQENVVSVEVVRAGQPPVILKKSGNEWIVRQPIETPADANTVDSLVRAAASARIERTFEQGAQEAEKYGLKKPRITVKIQAGSDQKVVLFGADDFTGNQVYAQVQGSPKVYLTSDYLYTSADKELKDWRNRKVLIFDRNNAQVVEIQREKELIRLAKQNDRWLLQAPVQEPADDSTVSSLLSAIEFGEAQKFVVEQAADLKPYGLDKPNVSVRIREQGKDSWKTLELGKKEDTQYLARNPERTPVFTVQQDLYDKLVQKLWEFRNKTVADLKQDEVARLEFRRGGAVIVLNQQESKQGTKWLVEKPDAQKGKESFTYKFWYPLTDIKFQSLEEGTGKGTVFAKPDIQVVATLKKGGVRNFEFVKSGDEYWARSVEGKRQGKISKESFEGLQLKPEELV